MPKPYKARSLPSAQRRVRELTKLKDKLAEMVEEMACECKLLAKLAAKTPQFDNPLHICKAVQIRDKWLNRP